MKKFREILRPLMPMGLLEKRRRDYQLQSMGLPATKEMADAVIACRFDLWPAELSKPKQPWLLLDVGANEGEFAAAASKLVDLQGVHAFEPQPSCHARLNEVLSSIPNSHLHGVALGPGRGEIELLCTSNSKLASVLPPDNQVADGYSDGVFDVKSRLKVPLLPLDEVIPAGTAVGLLKIDVQGYELPVLEGARETLRHTQALFMEVNYVRHYEGGATFDDLHETIRRLGFRTFGISEPYCGPHGPMWADAVYVRA